MPEARFLDSARYFPSVTWKFRFPVRKSPPHLFSRKLSTAKPTMLAQHPATAAPPASPVSPKAAQIAALLIGSVSAIPTITETKIPIKNGCNSVAHIMAFPTALAAAPIAGAHQMDKPAPMKMVTNGVTIISILVSLDTAFTEFGCKDGDNQYCQRTACSTQGICGHTDGCQ